METYGLSFLGLAELSVAEAHLYRELDSVAVELSKDLPEHIPVTHRPFCWPCALFRAFLPVLRLEPTFNVNVMRSIFLFFFLFNLIYFNNYDITIIC